MKYFTWTPALKETVQLGKFVGQPWYVSQTQP